MSDSLRTSTLMIEKGLPFWKASSRFRDQEKITMKHRTKFFLAAISAISLLVLTACGNSSYYWQNSSIQIKVDGTLNLSSYNAIDLLPSNRTSTGASTAKITLNEVFDGGNLNISGKYEDGYVKFNFRGHSLFQVCPDIVFCQDPSNTALSQVGAQSTVKALGNSKAMSESQNRRRTTGVGGICSLVPTMYTSTNPRFPGSGNVFFVVCATDANTRTPIASYTGPNYVGIFSPVLDMTGDKEPYGWYVSGGVLNNSGGKNPIVVTQPTSNPTFTPCPIFASPNPTPTGSPTPIPYPNPTPSC